MSAFLTIVLTAKLHNEQQVRLSLVISLTRQSHNQSTLQTVCKTNPITEKAVVTENFDSQDPTEGCKNRILQQLV